jgi:hypothetical protein
VSLTTGKVRSQKDQARFDQLLNNLDVGDRSQSHFCPPEFNKQKILGVKGLHHKRTKGKR